MALSAAFLAPAPFGLKLLIGLAAVDDGPKVRDLAIAGGVAFGSAHGVLRYRLLSRPRLSVTNVAWLAPYALPQGTETFTFRDIGAPAEQCCARVDYDRFGQIFGSQ